MHSKTEPLVEMVVIPGTHTVDNGRKRAPNRGLLTVSHGRRPSRTEGSHIPHVPGQLELRSTNLILSMSLPADGQGHTNKQAKERIIDD